MAVEQEEQGDLGREYSEYNNKLMKDGMWKMGLLIKIQAMYDMSAKVYDHVAARRFYREANRRLGMFPEEIRNEVRAKVLKEKGETFRPRLKPNEDHYRVKKDKELQEMIYWLDKGSRLLEILTDVGKAAGYWGLTTSQGTGVG